ncbi:hypothetical protein BC830DRAFT_1154640 [Chytriomyces sp. MP71]|nr:hypothetical protein BC830DRAFT_1154640 [Chytriomyces sp. MP71]
MKPFQILKTMTIASVPALTDPNEFKAFSLTKVEKLTETTSRFTFALPAGATELGLPTASFIVIKYLKGVKDDGSPDVIFRPYTPIEDPSRGATGTFDLVVKRYPTGLVSNYIFGLKVGDSIELKGPILKYKYVANEFKHIGLVAGGTGITPHLQIIQRVLSNPEDQTKLSLIFANVSVPEIILKDYIDNLVAQHPSRLSVYYTVDKPSADWAGYSGYVSADLITSALPKPGEGKVFVCGPPPFYAHVSGSKAPDFSQGEVGGLLANLGYTSEHVFKI